MIQKPCRCCSVFSSAVDPIHIWPDELQQINLFVFYPYVEFVLESVLCWEQVFLSVSRLHVVSCSVVAAECKVRALDTARGSGARMRGTVTGSRGKSNGAFE